MNTNAKDWEILIQDEEGAILFSSYRCPRCGKYQDWFAYTEIEHKLIEPFQVIGKCKRCKSDVVVTFRQKEKSQIIRLSSVQRVPKS